jgi:hypothetical protein
MCPSTSAREVWFRAQRAGKTTTIRMLVSPGRTGGGCASAASTSAPLHEAMASAHRRVADLYRTTGRENWSTSRMLPPARCRIDELADGRASEHRRQSLDVLLGMRQRLGIAQALLGEPDVDPRRAGERPRSGGIREIRKPGGSDGARIAVSFRPRSRRSSRRDRVAIIHRGRTAAGSCGLSARWPSIACAGARRPRAGEMLAPAGRSTPSPRSTATATACDGRIHRTAAGASSALGGNRCLPWSGRSTLEEASEITGGETAEVPASSKTSFKFASNGAPSVVLSSSR